MTARSSVRQLITSSCCAQTAGNAIGRPALTWLDGSVASSGGHSAPLSGQLPGIFTFESRTTLLIILHNDPDNKATVVFAMKRSCLKHNTETVNQSHDANARLRFDVSTLESLPYLLLKEASQSGPFGFCPPDMRHSLGRHQYCTGQDRRTLT